MKVARERVPQIGRMSSAAARIAALIELAARACVETT